MNIEPISFCTTPMYLLNDDQELMQGTGFFYIRKTKAGNVLFLVTNLHVVTGSDPEDKVAPVGNKIEFYFHRSPTNPRDVKRWRMPLYTQCGMSRWITSDTFPDSDVAVILIPGEVWKDCHVTALDVGSAEPFMKVRPTTQVALVGYPHGFYDQTNSLPIWKSGAVASEPEADFNGKPLFLVDAAVFRGMSGCPVIAYAHGGYETTQGGYTASPGFATQFLGIFSSFHTRRQFLHLATGSPDSGIGVNQEVSLELNNVWKAHLIVDMIENLDIEKYCREILCKCRPIPQ